MIEEKILILLRQGKIGKWFSEIGQEAIAIGTNLAMRFCMNPVIKIAGFGYEQNPCFRL
jgi:TPP-dependent pyruvate/acetoin dehydrogenase alpha subunit